MDTITPIYRPNVAAIIRRSDNKILVGERSRIGPARGNSRKAESSRERLLNKRSNENYSRK